MQRFTAVSTHIFQMRSLWISIANAFNGKIYSWTRTYLSSQPRKKLERTAIRSMYFALLSIITINKSIWTYVLNFIFFLLHWFICSSETDCSENSIVSYRGSWICFYITKYSMHTMYTYATHAEICQNLLILDTSIHKMSIITLKQLSFVWPIYKICVISVFRN
jgi:hypothetical protein